MYLWGNKKFAIWRIFIILPATKLLPSQKFIWAPTRVQHCYVAQAPSDKTKRATSSCRAHVTSLHFVLSPHVVMQRITP